MLKWIACGFHFVCESMLRVVFRTGIIGSKMHASVVSGSFPRLLFITVWDTYNVFYPVLKKQKQKNCITHFFIFSPFESNFIISGVHAAGAGRAHARHMEVRGQLCASGSLLMPFCDSGDDPRSAGFSVEHLTRPVPLLSPKSFLLYRSFSQKNAMLLQPYKH